MAILSYYPFNAGYSMLFINIMYSFIFPIVHICIYKSCSITIVHYPIVS